MGRLSKEEIEAGLGELVGWAVSGNRLKKEYKFADFNEAFGFMARASMEIEKMNHHPDWSNTYDRVVIELTTHDAGGITANDLKLARILDSLV